MSYRGERERLLGGDGRDEEARGETPVTTTMDEERGGGGSRRRRHCCF